MSIDVDSKVISQSDASTVFEDVDGADLGVDEFIAELGEE